MSEGVQAWIDGRPVSTLPLPDRGLEFGDGVFETLPLIGGHIPWLGHHLQRLREGLARLGFPPSAADQAHAHIRNALTACPGSGVMRLTVTRGGGPRGYTPPIEPQTRYLLQAWAGDSVGQPRLPPANVQLCSIVLPWQPALAGIKHLNRLEQVLAARERQRAGMDEMLMTDQAGSAVSVISGNLFLVRGRALLTPTLAQCGILGTRRRLLLEDLGPALGLECREATLAESEIDTADEVFYCNSLRGYQPVGRYREHCWTRHPTLDRVQALYRERLKTCDA